MTSDDFTSPDLELQHPRVAGRYQLQGRIATGGMGVVWRATDLLLARTVAVKQLLLGPQLSEEAAEEARARATREARIAARLHHPAAIAVYDIVIEDDTPWLVMEYLPSRSLADVLTDQGPLPAAQVARIGAALAGALAAAHAEGIVHRDVKPANVLLGDDGTAKITDFGVSRATWEVAVTQTGMVAGTPAYLAPEVARGEEPTAAADVFALGSTLYAAVEGEPPFGLGDNPLAVLRTVAEAKVPAPRRAGPLTDPLSALLSADPDDRPSAESAATTLAAVAAGAPPAEVATVPDLAVPATSTAPEPDDRSRWRRRAVALTLVACLAVVAGLVLASLVAGPDNDARATRPAPFPTPPAAPAEVQQTVREYFAVLPDDTRTAWRFLSEAERTRVGGLAAYERAWSEVSYVDPITDIVVDGYYARLELLFERTDGTATIEPYQLAVRSNAGGPPIIESVTRTGPGRPVPPTDRDDTESSGPPESDRTAAPDTAAPVPEPVGSAADPSPSAPTPTEPATEPTQTPPGSDPSLPTTEPAPGWDQYPPFPDTMGSGPGSQGPN